MHISIQKRGNLTLVSSFQFSFRLLIFLKIQSQISFKLSTLVLLTHAQVPLLGIKCELYYNITCSTYVMNSTNHCYQILLLNAYTLKPVCFSVGAIQMTTSLHLLWMMCHFFKPMIGYQCLSMSQIVNDENLSLLKIFKN